MHAEILLNKCKTEARMGLRKNVVTYQIVIYLRPLFLQP